MRHARITTDPTALKHNLAQVRKLAADSQVLAMVKADAYGHGVAACLPALADADALGVACFAEATELHRLGWQKPIVLIEGVFSESEWLAACRLGWQCLLHHQPQLGWALAHPPKVGSPTRTLWLKLNTGMSRLGFMPDQILGVAKQLHEVGYRLILTSHFANADDHSHPLNAEQIRIFRRTLVNLKQQLATHIQASLCNSAGILHFPAQHQDWVRPGIMLYGSSPVLGQSAEQLGLRPVMRLTAALMAIHHLPAGTAVGYGSRWLCPSDSVLGVVSIGYGDGYPRVVDDTAYVAVIPHQDGQHTCYLCPIRGRVAMDMLLIDLSAMATQVTPRIGSTVELWGSIVDIDTVAQSANTISYELYCRLGGRPQRSTTAESLAPAPPPTS